MSFVGILVFMCTLLAHAEHVASNCPLSGCTPSRSFTSESDRFNQTTRTPPLLWSSEKYRPSGDGCVTNGARIVCPLDPSQNASLVSWDFSANSWTVTLSGEVSLPLMDIGGDVIVTDGTVLIKYDSAGTPQGDPVLLYPTHGSVFDLSITTSSIAILLYKCGFIATYLTDGIPHAGLWLNDSVSGVEGTFIPLAAAAVNGDRLYIISAFKAYNHLLWQQSKSLLQSIHLRVYAIDIQSTISERIKIVWHRNFVLNGTLPYLHDSITVCTRGLGASNNRHLLQAKSAIPIASITVYNETIVSAVNFNCNSSQLHSNHQSLLVIIEDNITKSTVKFMQLSADTIHSLAYYATAPVLGGETSDTAKCETGNDRFWVSRLHSSVTASESISNCTVLEERNLVTGSLVRELNLCEILQKDNAIATTDLMLLLLHTSSSHMQPTVKESQNVHVRDTPSRAPVSAVFLFLGLITETSDKSKFFPLPRTAFDVHMVSLEVSSTGGTKLHWDISLPAGEPAVGQIATVNGARDSLIVVTTTTATYAYVIG